MCDYVDSYFQNNTHTEKGVSLSWATPQSDSILPKGASKGYQGTRADFRWDMANTFFFSAVPHTLQGLRSLTRDQTGALHSKCMDCQGIPWTCLFLKVRVYFNVIRKVKASISSPQWHGDIKFPLKIIYFVNLSLIRKHHVNNNPGVYHSRLGGKKNSFQSPWQNLKRICTIPRTVYKKP